MNIIAGQVLIYGGNLFGKIDDPIFTICG